MAKTDARNWMKTIGRYWFRWLLSIMLLVDVWLHSHWSVALSLCLLFAYTEVSAFVLRGHGEDIRSLKHEK
jgi:hypothetical protein